MGHEESHLRVGVRQWTLRRRAIRAVLLLAALGGWAASEQPCAAAEPAVTILSDFEDPSVATRVTEVRNAARGDSKVELISIPARGKGALAVEVGATAANVSVACDLTFREATRLPQADRIATFYWLNEGSVQVAFRLRDARGQVFETPPVAADQRRRWIKLTADVDPATLIRRQGDGPPAYPIEVLGYRVFALRVGRQTVFLDELQVEHQAAPQDLIHGEFEFNEPTRIYAPGTPVQAAVVLENRSRQRVLETSVDLAWTRPDGTVLQTQNARVRLQPSGNDYRSYQRLDFSQTIREPGVYRLVARVRAPGWPLPNVFETSIAVTPSNRGISRGRATFFGVQSNLLREPERDQLLEISIARDLGVNLLALTAPWSVLEPKPGVRELTALNKVIDALATKDVATMLVLSEPPDWLPPDTAARTQRLAELLDALAGYFGARMPLVQVGEVFELPNLAARLAATATLRQRLAEQKRDLTVLPPAIRVDDPEAATAVAAFLREHPDWPLVFLTRGDLSDSLRQLSEFRRRGQFDWRATHWWCHEAEPLVGSGSLVDADALVRFHVQAASAGVGGLIWSDLRDDDNDPTRPEALRGLVRRDFSPKTTLLGYAAIAGQLTGYQYAGPVAQTPDTFDSGLFIGGGRQVAVLLPRPGRILPATLTLAPRVRGDLEVQDFDRRIRPVLSSSQPPLITTIPRPLFVALALPQPDPEPKLGLGYPWLRVPATVFCRDRAAFTVGIDAVAPIREGYVQLIVPRNAPVEASFSATGLRLEPGESLRQDVAIKLKQSPEEFTGTELSLRVSVEGDLLTIPIDVRPRADIHPLGRGPVTGADHRIAAPVPPGNQRTTASATIHAAFTPDALHLAVAIQDDHFVLPPTARGAPGPGGGDQLLVGIVREGAERPTEVQIPLGADEPAIAPLTGTSLDQLQGWRCAVEGQPQAAARTCRLTIPATALGAASLADGDQLLLAVRYVDDDADGFAPIPITWGSGLDGSRETAGYRWARLEESTPPTQP